MNAQLLSQSRVGLSSDERPEATESSAKSALMRVREKEEESWRWRTRWR